ncbi:MAG: fibronectin type III domain-containing protein [Ignavibacteria bacterium]|nr:fibronectin type III domain-containing protein [Ignavibacteria bacterium]
MKTKIKNRLIQCLLVLFSLFLFFLASPGFASVPDSPRDLEATSVSHNKIRLKWIDVSNNELGFRIEVKNQNSTQWNFLTNVPRNVRRFLVRNLNPNSNYLFRVSAFNPSGVSAPSNPEGAKTFPDSNFKFTPAPPSGLTSEILSPYTVKLNWTDNSFNEFLFIVEIKRPMDSLWRIAGSVPQDRIMRINDGLNPERTYGFRVRAANPWGRSLPSNMVTVTTPPDSNLNNPPFAPSLLRGFAIGHRAVMMKWNDNSRNETGFVIQRKRELTPTPSQWVTIDTIPANRERYRDSVGIEPHSRYAYRVYAFNNFGNSQFSNLLIVHTPPMNLISNPNIGNYHAPLNWASIQNSENFRIEVSFDEDFESVVYEDQLENVNSYNIPVGELSNTQSYFIRVVGLLNDDIEIFSEPIFVDGSSTNISDPSGTIPEKFSLSQNYPNPFNPETNIKFSLPVSGLTKLSVYDVSGRMVAELINTNLVAGEYTYTFSGVSLSSGVYFYKLTSGNFVDVKRMILVK